MLFCYVTGVFGMLHRICDTPFLALYNACEEQGYCKLHHVPHSKKELEAGTIGAQISIC